MSRVIKFQFLYKGMPFSSTNKGFNWHKKVYSLDDFMNNSLYELSDIHGSCELVAKRQFTGFSDKNGVNIYEGDIVKEVRKNPAWDADMVNNIEVKSKGASFKVGSLVLSSYAGITFEVIGNIHQDRSLLNE